MKILIYIDIISNILKEFYPKKIKKKVVP